MTRLTPGRVLLLAGLVLLAVLVQTSLVARLPLPGQAPDLVLVVVLAAGVGAGRTVGLSTGFGAGLLADSQTDHELGRLALAYLVAGYLAGRLHDDDRGRGRDGRSRTIGFLGVLLGAVAALAVYLAQGLTLGDPRTALSALSPGLLSAIAYDLLLVPVVVPAVAAVVRSDASSR